MLASNNFHQLGLWGWVELSQPEIFPPLEYTRSAVSFFKFENRKLLLTFLLLTAINIWPKTMNIFENTTADMTVNQ